MPDHYDKFTLKSGNNTSFKEMGSSIPGINHESEGNTDLPDGRSGSSAFQHSKIDGADHTKDGKGKHPGTYRAHNMERPEGYDQFGNPIEEPAATKKIGDKMREIKVEQEDKEDVTTDTNDLKNDSDDDKPGLEDAGTGAISLLQ